MKYKMLALILALTAVCWAQTATQSTPTTPQQSAAPEKGKCACCDKMAASDSKDAHAACMRKHNGKEMGCCSGKDGTSCCAGKDATSCMKNGKDAAACCKDCCGKDKDKSASASCCDRKAGKGCSKSCCGANKTEKPA